MRVFKVADGSSWVARVEEGAPEDGIRRNGYDAIVFEPEPEPVQAVLRLVYRPSGWLQGASVEELVSALEEGVLVRARWG